MTLRDLTNNVVVTPSLAPAVRVNGTATGTTVDLFGYDSAVIAVQFGTWTDGTHTPSVQHSTDNVTFNNVATTDLSATFAALTSATGANKIQQVGYRGSQRYVRVVLTTTGATTGALSAAHVIAGRPKNS